ncbi:MAG TPA: hypothetical protein VKE95_05485 [Burkholderiales bacterium]|nr:hypothetical protein [Burkholderiales bacterium]
MYDTAAPVPQPAPRHTTPAGLVGMFGLFAALCAVFGLVVTVAEGFEDAAQARWPVVAALIEHGAVEARGTDRRGGAPLWQLRYRVRYEVDGREHKATLTSHTTASDETLAEMRAWAGRHPRNGGIDVRYDPAQPARALFTADVPGAGPRTATNLELTLVATLAAVALLWLARSMAAREPPDAATRDLSPAGKRAWGLVCGAMGLLVIAIGIRSALAAWHPLASQDFIFLPAGLIFVFGGALLALPPGRADLNRLLGTLLVTAFAVTLDWIAFGPGERRFSGGISLGVGIPLPVNETFGRVVFGIPAAILDVVALALWAGQIRRLL